MDTTTQAPQLSHDENNLNLLSIFHYILAGLAALFACFPIIHIAIGIAMLAGLLDSSNGDNPPEFVGWIFVGVGSVLFLLGMTFAACLAVAGRFIARRVHHTFCFVMAVISCFFVPFGTALGVVTLIVITKPNVREMFQPHR